MTQINLVDAFRSTGIGSINVNKELAHEIGLQAAVFLGELISRYEFHKSRNELDQEGYFYLTEPKMQELTTLKRSVQDKCIKILQDAKGFITKDNRGVKGKEMKRHFKLHIDKVVAWLESKGVEKQQALIKDVEIEQEGCRNSTGKGVEKQHAQGCRKTTTSNTYSFNNTKNNTLYSDQSKSINHDDIFAMKIPEQLQMGMIHLIDGLNYHSVDLKSIETLYKKNQGKINDSEFNQVLDNVIEYYTNKGEKISNITPLLSSAINNYLMDKQKPKVVNHKSVRKEILPDWFEDAMKYYKDKPEQAKTIEGYPYEKLLADFNFAEKLLKIDPTNEIYLDKYAKANRELNKYGFITRSA